jgi:hypothetical protein
MSARIATDKHIASVAVFIRKVVTHQIADLLKKENILSFNYKYGENTPITECNTKEAIELTDVDAYLLMKSLSYQSCEHPEWKDSIAKEMLDSSINYLEDTVPDIKTKSANSKTWSI